MKCKNNKQYNWENWQINLGGTLAIVTITLFILTLFDMNDKSMVWKIEFVIGFVFLIVSYLLLFIGYLKEKCKKYNPKLLKPSLLI